MGRKKGSRNKAAPKAKRRFKMSKVGWILSIALVEVILSAFWPGVIEAGAGLLLVVSQICIAFSKEPSRISEEYAAALYNDFTVLSASQQEIGMKLEGLTQANMNLQQALLKVAEGK